MKKIEFLGFQYNYELKKKIYNEEDFYSPNSMLKKKILYIVFTLMVIVLSNSIKFWVSSVTYGVGDIVKNDIYSPKTVIYKDSFARNRIMQEVVNNFGKEYFSVSDTEEYYINNFKKFISVVKEYKKNKESRVAESFQNQTGIDIPRDIFIKYSKFSETQLDEKQITIENELKRIYNKGVYQEKDSIIVDNEIKKEIEERYNKTDRQVINLFTGPNHILDEEKTKKRLEERLSQIKDKKNKIDAGQLVIKKGTILTANDIKTLDIIGVYSLRHLAILSFVNLFFVIVVSCMFYLTCYRLYKDDFLNRNKYKTLFLLIIFPILIVRFFSPQYIYLLPIDAIIFLLLVLISDRLAFATGLFSMLYILPMMDYDFKFFTVNVFSLLVISFLVKKLKTRIEIVHLGIKVAVLKASLYVALLYSSNELYSDSILKVLELLMAGILSGMVVIAFLPYFERTFNILTGFRLLELGDLSTPLLKEFSLVAPGSFQHSLMVATLSENAAEKIGANPIFSRVAAYYHDIGKMKRAKYYVENQLDNENPHDHISPNMSALIIKSHAKDGVEIAKKYQIAKEIRDVMKEHHGTTLLAYFYNKAKIEDPTVKMEDFRYSGPTPKSKESAIIMLADSVEAAVRSIDKKTPEKIENMIRKIINIKIEEGQLADADLTFREIEIIIESFKKNLESMHHVRMKYPGQK